MDRRGMARLSARCAARFALRLSRLRPLRARGGAPLQSQQAAARSLCAQAARGGALDRCAARLSGPLAPRGSELRSARQCAGDAQGRSDVEPLRLVARQEAAHAVVRHGDLRGAFARADQTTCRRAAAQARHLRRPRPPQGDRASPAHRGDRDRAAADPRLRAGSLPAGSAACRTIGATTRSAFSHPSRVISPGTIRTNCASPSAGSMLPGSR